MKIEKLSGKRGERETRFQSRWNPEEKWQLCYVMPSHYSASSPQPSSSFLSNSAPPPPTCFLSPPSLAARSEECRLPAYGCESLAHIMQA